MIAAILFLSNTVFWCVFLYPFIIIRFLLPFKTVTHFCNKLILWIAESWIEHNSLNLEWTQNIQWHVQMDAHLNPETSYMVCVNHQSWMDIIVLQHVLNKKIPFLRFFIKKQLRYIPLLGGAWAALDYPFMQRYSKEYLEKHPEKRGEDLKTAQKSLEKFRGRPVSILNFLEGTRFTKAKHQVQASPFKHLLLPKAGGMAATLEGLNQQIRSLLDITIVYPHGPVSIWEVFRGKLDEVVIHVQEVPLPFEFKTGEYAGNPEFRDKVQQWVHQLWLAKDARIESLLQTYKT